MELKLNLEANTVRNIYGVSAEFVQTLSDAVDKKLRELSGDDVRGPLEILEAKTIKELACHCNTVEEVVFLTKAIVSATFDMRTIRDALAVGLGI